VRSFGTSPVANCTTKRKHFCKSELQVEGLEPRPYRSRDHHPSHWATPTPCAHSHVCGFYPSRVHSQLSIPLLGGWHCRFGKTVDAIVFALKNCSRYNRSQPCNSRKFLRKTRKTPFSGHFWHNCRPLITPKISTFLANRPFESCLETVNLQSQFCRFSIFGNLRGGGGLFFFCSID
jgi:hypothetical protein